VKGDERRIYGLQQPLTGAEVRVRISANTSSSPDFEGIFSLWESFVFGRFSLKMLFGRLVKHHSRCGFEASPFLLIASSPGAALQRDAL
jgi:hypothetical protein